MLSAFRVMLRNAASVVFLGGAGVSTESGIPDFRSRDGLYHKTEKRFSRYQPEFNATLLMPAGITSEASIRYKDEDKLLSSADDVDKVYVEQILPAKMRWNLESIRRFRFLREILTMFRTVFAVLGKEYR